MPIPIPANLQLVLDALNGGYGAERMRYGATVVKGREMSAAGRPVREINALHLPLEAFIRPARLLQEKLRKLVDQWRRTPKSRRERAAYLKAHPEVERQITDMVKRFPGKRFSKRDIIQLFLDPSSVSFPDNPTLTAEFEAVRLFWIVLDNNTIPIRRCALPRCQQYFADVTGQRKRRKRCCCRKHSGALVVECRRQREGKESLARATKAIRVWQRTHPSQDWTPWVSRRTALSRNFLTRKVNEGKLKTPR